jgi:adenylate kinase family enzyme
MDTFPYRRLVVTGTTSSGKSTLAKRLAEQLQLDFIELDALHWQPNWTPAPLEDFRARVETATRSGSWVVAGNYHVVRDRIWPKAEAVIWLDYSFPVIFWRLLTRTLRRGIMQEELWNGNREKFWWHLKLWSEESLFHWLIKTYWRRKREFPILFSQAEHRHLHILRFRSPAETAAWLREMSESLSRMQRLA